MLDTSDLYLLFTTLILCNYAFFILSFITVIKLILCNYAFLHYLLLQ